MQLSVVAVPHFLLQAEIATAFKDVVGERRLWHVEGCSITDYKVCIIIIIIIALQLSDLFNQGVKNGFDWLSKMVKDKRKGKLPQGGSSSAIKS